MVNKLSSVLGYFIIIYFFSIVDERIISHVSKVITNIKRELEFIGIKLIDWRIDKESSICVFNLYGDLNRVEEVEKLIDEKLRNSLANLVNYRKIAAHRLEQSIYSLTDVSQDLSEVNILRKYFDFIAHLSKLRSLEKIELESIKNRNIEWCIKHRKKQIKDNIQLIYSVIDKWQKDGFFDLSEEAFSILYLLYKSNPINRESIIEVGSFALKIHPEIVDIHLNGMKQKGFLEKMQGKLFLAKKTQNFLREFLPLVTKIEKSGIRAASLRNLILPHDEEGAQTKYIVHRNGNISNFSTNKLLESLILAGVDSDVANKAIYAIVEYTDQRDIIPESELTSLVKMILDVLDPTGESRLKYDFFINTRNKIMIKYKELILPFSYDTFRLIVKEKLLSKSSFKVTSSIIDMIVTHVLKIIRSTFSLAFKDITRNESIIIEEDYLNTVIEEILKNSIPFYKQVSEEKINRLIRDTLTKSISFFNKVLTCEEYLGVELLNDFFEGAKNLLWAVLIDLGYWPHPNMISSASLISQIIKKSDLKSDKKKLFKRIDEFSRRVAQLILKIRPLSFGMIDDKMLKQVREISKFGIRVSKQLLERINYSNG